MTKKPSKGRKRSILDQVRKPTAPPTKAMGKRKPEEKIHPAGRNVKHKPQDKNDADL